MDTTGVGWGPTIAKVANAGIMSGLVLDGVKCPESLQCWYTYSWRLDSSS